MLCSYKTIPQHGTFTTALRLSVFMIALMDTFTKYPQLRASALNMGSIIIKTPLPNLALSVLR